MWLLVWKDPGRQVSVTTVADNGNDHGLLQFLRQLQCRSHRSSRRDTTEDTLFRSQAARGLLGDLLPDVDLPVDQARVIDGRQILDRKSVV